MASQPGSKTAVGKRPIRHDGYDKVTGKALYGADTNLPGMLHGRILRSPHAHARIKSIDLSAALAHPEVKAIVTSSDLSPLPDKPAEVGEDLYANMKYVRDRILASDKVLFKGEDPMGEYNIRLVDKTGKVLLEKRMNYNING